MRVLRVYHGGRNPAHRARERMLAATGIDLSLVVPAYWPEMGETHLQEQYPIIELAVRRPGDVNRHAYNDRGVLRQLIHDARPDILDLHEEPFSVASNQWLTAVSAQLPVVMYTAQNIDKRFPPPFTHYERAAHRRVAALYPCGAQAASVARGKGFAGLIDVIPLGYDPLAFREGMQSLDEDLVFALVGRLVPEKGVRTAVHVVAHVNAFRPARLVVVGTGPEEGPARALAAALGVRDRVEVEPWRSATELAELYRRAHVTLVPSLSTTTWTEQFGRVIVEAQASGSVVAGYASGSIPEVAGNAGVLVDPGNVSELADAVVRLVGDPELYAAHRARGLALSRSRTWAQVAERQAELYRRAAAGEIERVDLPESPRTRRALARAEFGATASTIAGDRPFALPLLRQGGAASSALAAAIDARAEIMARLRMVTTPPT